MQLVYSRRARLIKYGVVTLLAMLFITLTACVQSDLSVLEGDASQNAEVLAIAKATLTGTKLAPTISGDITLEETVAGLRMQGTFENIPAGMHGFHIHEGESCADAGKAAGGHFNPRGVDHGHLPSSGFESAHAGDLGNLLATATAPADWALEIPGLTLTPGEFSVANRTFILHADPDDLSQPTGNAGPRIACGVIQPMALAQ